MDPQFQSAECWDDLKSWLWDVHSSVEIPRSVAGAVSPACTVPMLLLPWEVWGRGLGTSSETLLLFSPGLCDLQTKLGKPNIVAVLKLLCGVWPFLQSGLCYHVMGEEQPAGLRVLPCFLHPLPCAWRTSVTRGAVTVTDGWDCFGAVGSNAQLQQASAGVLGLFFISTGFKWWLWSFVLIWRAWIVIWDPELKLLAIFCQLFFFFNMEMQQYDLKVFDNK